MGQSSSTPQDNLLSSDSTEANPVAGASTDIHSESTRDPGDESSSSQPGSSRSSSIRKSILNFVKPSNLRSRVSSIASQPTDLRRSWRNSIFRHKDSPPTSSSASSTAGPSTASLSPTDKGKKPERSDSNYSDLEDTPTPVDLDLPIEQLSSPISYPTSETLPDIHTPPEIVESLEPVTASPEDDETNTLYVSDPGEPELGQQPPVYQQEGPEPIAPSEPQPQTSSSPSPTPRQFPPPGTLVVVQGIVHTTDVSRNNTQGTDSNSTSTSTLRPALTSPDTTTESGASRARNRLSALLRPRSSSRSPSTAANDSVPSVTITPPTDLDLPLSSGAEPEMSEGFAQATSLTNESADALPGQIPSVENPTLSPTNHHNPTPSISSSSIDVLGTLLSVAAAATAASLLTGSSEPILSSGLTPPNPSPVPPTNNNNVPPIPNTPLADISAAGRAERMRHAWSTIRERLGLRPSAPPLEQDTRNIDVPAISSTATPAEPVTPILLPDTRELMLAEMTRAFNVGFGLNGNGGPTSGNNNGEPAVMSDMNSASNNRESSDSGRPPLATLPPEGSFDRFLMDLQIDLRTALTQAEDPPAPPPQGRRSTPPETLQQAQGTEAGTEDVNGDGSSSAVLPEAQHIGNQHEDHHPRVSPEGIHAVNVDSDRSSMPEIYGTNSESEEAEDSDDDDVHSARHASNPRLHNAPRTPTLGAGRIDASGRINWWRLYRFPPVMPRLSTTNFRQAFVPTGTSATTTPPIPPPSPVAPSTTASEGLVSLSSEATSSSPSPTSIPPPQASNQEPPTQQAVVPVIVVGLQSVNSDWRPDMPPPDENDVFDHHHGAGEVGSGGGHEMFGDDDDFDGFGNYQHAEFVPDETAGHGRGVERGHGGRARGWPSRAVNAIRNLRPGLRPAPPTQHSLTTPGSRTFLIYVIGGYYPPDHTIVTGGPDNLDSFEALLELADLLGQVKPPTVSKDEIDKSGLEIIKAARLSQQENDGKVSSNCLDRCLICLDDYQPEEDIRIMTCRHAFHKTCVDEWLQTGRNNCPACRTTGVTPSVGNFASPSGI